MNPNYRFLLCSGTSGITLSQLFAQTWQDANGSAVFSFEDDTAFINDPVVSSNSYSGSAREYFRTRSFASYTGTPKLTLQSNGNFAYNRHNLVAMSERFDSAAWTKDNSTTGIAGTGPLGEANYGIRIIENTNNTQHQVTRSVTSVIGVHTISVDARADGTNWLRLQIFDGTSRSAWFNLAAGTIGSRNANALNHTMTALGNGWFRCTLTAAIATTTPTAAIGGASGDNNDSGYIGSTSNGFFINRAQLNLGSSALEYMRTGDHNLCLQSETFDNGSWSKFGASVTANSVASPDGATTADTVTPSSAIGVVVQNSIVPAGQSVFSVFAKAGTSSTFNVTVDAGGNGYTATFNLSAGTAGAATQAGTGGTVSSGTSGISAAPNGFYRCWLAVTTSGTNNAALSVSGNGLTAYVFGAQVEYGTTPGKYVPTTSAAVYSNYIELPYTWDSTGAALGYLPEEARTNSIRNNTMQGASAPSTLPTYWFAGALASGVTRSVVGTATDIGVSCIDIRFSGTPSASGFCEIALDNTIAATVSQVLTNSAFLSYSAGSTTNVGTPYFKIDELNSGGSFLATQSSNLTQVTAALARQQKTFTIGNASTAKYALYVGFPVTNGQAIDITLRIGWPQAELGAFATSPIPTTSASVTRAADNASVATSVLPFNAATGTLFAKSTAFGNFFVTASIDDGTANNRISWERDSSTRQSWTLRIGGASSSAASSPTEGDTAVELKSAYAFASNDYKAYSNGTARFTNTAAGTISGLNILRFGRSSSSGPAAGTEKLVAYFPRRISNADLQTMTT